MRVRAAPSTLDRPAAARDAAAMGATPRRAEYLVRHHLHRHGQVERSVFLAGRDAQQRVRRSQILVARAAVLAAEQRCRPAPRRSPRRPARPPRARRARGNSGRVRAKCRPAPARSPRALRQRSRRRAPAPAGHRRRRRAPLASGCGNCRGRTSASSSSSMFFMARAAAPMLPGCEVSTRTKRIGGGVISLLF